MFFLKKKIYILDVLKMLVAKVVHMDSCKFRSSLKELSLELLSWPALSVHGISGFFLNIINNFL